MLSEKKVKIDADPQYFRPTEVEMLMGDRTKAEEKLGWVSGFSIDELVQDVVELDFKSLRK